MDIPSLKEQWADYFDFGTAISVSEALSDSRMAFTARQFSIITPGNALKPDALLDIEASRRLAGSSGDETAVSISMEGAAPILDFAKENGLKVHGHVLVWHQQTPEAFFH